MPGINQFLLVANDGELYGVDVCAVQEIRVYQALTRLPHAPAHVLGILNASGKILPVVDLRCRLWGEITTPSPWHVIVVVMSADAHCGILMDTANEIIEIAADKIDPMPTKTEPSCYSGVFNYPDHDGSEERTVAILDLKIITRFSLQIPAFQPAEEAAGFA